MIFLRNAFLKVPVDMRKTSTLTIEKNVRVVQISKGSKPARRVYWSLRRVACSVLATYGLRAQWPFATYLYIAGYWAYLQKI